MRLFFLAAALAVAACGSDADSGSPFSDASGSSSSGSSGASLVPPDAGAASDSPDSGALPATCEGDCREMSLVVRKGNLKIAFDRAQFGFDRSSAYPTLQLAAYQGGDDACPTTTQPEHALQLDGVPLPLDATLLQAIAGVTGTLFDFEGDLAASSTVLHATAIDVRPVAASLDVTSGEAFIAFDVRLEFGADLVAEGHVFAAHCASIDH